MEANVDNKTIIALAVAMIGGSAYGASDYVDTAQVISSKPIIERVAESRQECDPAPAPQKSSSGIIAPILGGVVGGLLGHQVGQGRGQTAATIAGAAGGAVAGSAIANRTGQQSAQQCRTVQSSREVVNGYDVVYRYNGRDVNVALPYDPGKTIKVGVAAILDERTADGRRDNDRDAERDARPVTSANTGDNYSDRPYRSRTVPQ
jgi:uncharacterized protein YcfJ